MFYICVDVCHNSVRICSLIVIELIFAERGVLTEAKARPSASPVCELPVGFPRFVAAKKKNIVGGFVKSNSDKWKVVTGYNAVVQFLKRFLF